MMTKRWEMLMGGFVLLGLIAVGYLALKIGAGHRFTGGSYVIEARFADVGGLAVGSSVVVAGVTVGRVDAVRVDAADFSAWVSLRLEAGLKLPVDTMAGIKTKGLIGDKFVGLAPGAEDEVLGPGARITLTESAVDLGSLISRFAFGGVETGVNP